MAVAERGPRGYCAARLNLYGPAAFFGDVIWWTSRRHRWTPCGRASTRSTPSFCAWWTSGRGSPARWRAPSARPATADKFGLRPAREAMLIRKLIAHAGQGADRALTVRLWRELISDSLATAGAVPPGGLGRRRSRPRGGAGRGCGSAPRRPCARSPGRKTPWPRPRPRAASASWRSPEAAPGGAGSWPSPGSRCSPPCPAWPPGGRWPPWPWPRSRSNPPATTRPSGSPTQPSRRRRSSTP